MTGSPPSPLGRVGGVGVGIGCPRFQVDANGSYGPDDLDRLVALDRLRACSASSSPSPVTTWPVTAGWPPVSTPRSASTRASTASTPWSSAVTEWRLLGGVHQAGTPGRHRRGARRRSAWCTGQGVPWWIGGMFESGSAGGSPPRWPPCPARPCPATWLRRRPIWPATWSDPVAGGIDPADRVPHGGASTTGRAPDPAPDDAAIETLPVRGSCWPGPAT